MYHEGSKSRKMTGNCGWLKLQPILVLLQGFKTYVLSAFILKKSMVSCRVGLSSGKRSAWTTAFFLPGDDLLTSRSLSEWLRSGTSAAVEPSRPSSGTTVLLSRRDRRRSSAFCDVLVDVMTIS